MSEKVNDRALLNPSHAMHIILYTVHDIICAKQLNLHNLFMKSLMQWGEFSFLQTILVLSANIPFVKFHKIHFGRTRVKKYSFRPLRFHLIRCAKCLQVLKAILHNWLTHFINWVVFFGGGFIIVTESGNPSSPWQLANWASRCHALVLDTKVN